jgi:hypothetical protein
LSVRAASTKTPALPPAIDIGLHNDFAMLL